METRKKYFSYHFTQKKNRYTEQVIFNDLKDFENFLEAIEKDTPAKKIIESYMKRFNASSCSFTVLTQKV